MKWLPSNVYYLQSIPTYNAPNGTTVRHLVDVPYRYPIQVILLDYTMLVPRPCGRRKCHENEAIQP